MSEQILSQEDRSRLLKLARQAIQNRLDGGISEIEIEDQSLVLQTSGASFVTLRIDDQLRGCIGSLQAYRPLAVDVWENAQAAAFHDPRFSQLKAAELAHLKIEISVLSPPQPLPVENEEDLLSKIRPGIDGLILTSGSRRATFLPAVWESLPDPKEFLYHLKLKAGMGPNEWPEDIEFETYGSTSFAE
ncbi:MAG: AmmeMemoRadiSam system protein A [Bdellovibrionaceae bacterium]|nr:AmmeMemoRadiSam system protein A [Bdellovibrionales bacterium]MCB9083278.1 AmmeMemoRadiSam system protein A [Pseudobdellovibrionaceae bacterium]